MMGIVSFGVKWRVVYMLVFMLNIEVLVLLNGVGNVFKFVFRIEMKKRWNVRGSLCWKEWNWEIVFDVII